MTAQIKGLLFDKDGTLIDFTKTWLPPIQEAACLVAQSVNQPELAAKLIREIGYQSEHNAWTSDSIIAYKTSQDLLDCWANLTSKRLIKKLSPDIHCIVKKAMKNPTPVIQNIKSLLVDLNREYVLGVASMDDAANVKLSLQELDIMPLLSFYCGADSGYGVKPKPTMVHAFCQQTTLAPEQIVVIGDGLLDLRMAKAAGSIAIGVLSGTSTQVQLQPYADYILKDIGQLPALLTQFSE